jgi:hypothetical protein
MTSARRAAPGALLALAVAAMVLATFSEALQPSRTFYERDILGYWRPHRAALRAAVAEGGLPLWNPWLGFGAPFLADASSELVYPPTWLAMPLPLPLQFEVLAIGHCLLAAAGAAALARRLIAPQHDDQPQLRADRDSLPGSERGGTRGAAQHPLYQAAAGGAYALAGPMLSALGLYHHFAGAALMPWVLWALEGLLQRPCARHAIVLGALSAGQVLAGSGDLVLMTAIAGSVRLALHVPAGGARRLVALGPRLALAAALAASLSAVQWLPTVERGWNSWRGAQDFRTQTYWSLHPESLVDLAVPRLVSGADLTGDERLRLFEGREPLFACLYIGVVTLALGFVALVLRAPSALPLAAGFLLFVLLSLGRHTALYGLLLSLPGAGLMRYPQKYLLPAALFGALLAAAGVAALSRTWTELERRRARAVAGMFLALALLAAVFAWRLPADASGVVAALKLGRTALLLGLACLLLLRRAASAAPRPAAAAVLLCLGALDLVLVGRGTNDTGPVSLFEHRPAVLDRLAGGNSRIHSASESVACLAPDGGPAGWPRSWVAALGFVDTLRPPTGIGFGLFGSYDGEFTGLGSREAASFAGVVRGGLGTAAALKVLQLGGVEHVAFVGQSAPAGYDPVASFATPLYCPLQLLRVPGSLPRAYVVGREREEGESALAAALDPGFDPRREVLLAGVAARREVLAPDAAAAADRVFERGSARVVSRSADTLVVAARLPSRGVLVVLEAFDEGWTAEVDGRPAAVLRANGLFRAIRLEPGEHQVHFRYRPWSVRAGAVVSAAAALAAVALAIGVRVSRRGVEPAASRS